MNLENLTQFDKRRFKKLFGLYVRRQRENLKWSEDVLATKTDFSVLHIKQIESGQKSLKQTDFDTLCFVLDLEESELISIGKLTQIQNLMSVYKEISEHFPK